MNKVPFLSISFRPFFLLAAFIAVMNPTLWVSYYKGYSTLSFIQTDILYWHGHEMLFSFTSALVAGFIFTASANWTGGDPYKDEALLLLIGTWIVERFSFFIPMPTSMFFIFSNVFYPLMAFMLYLKLKDHPRQKFVFIPILIGLFIAKILHSYGYVFENNELESIGKEFGYGLIRFFILLIAGRIIPFFTRSKFKGIEVNVPKLVNIVSLASILLLSVPFFKNYMSSFWVILCFVAIFSNIFRQITWRPEVSIKAPILFILHIGVFFIILGLIFEVLGQVFDLFEFTQAPLHLQLAGGLGVIAIGIMSRVSLGHTGRVIKADKWTQLAYFCVVFGALIRVITPVMFPDAFSMSLHYASGFWTFGFMIFFINYYRILTTPRL